MKKFFRLLWFGFLSWLVTFSASVCLFGLKRRDERLFELLMGIVLTACTVGCTGLYLRKTRVTFFRDGILLGTAFAGCNILFDLLMFGFGPMKMPASDYLKNIGIAYLSMPLVSIGFGYALQTQRHDDEKEKKDLAGEARRRQGVP